MMKLSNESTTSMALNLTLKSTLFSALRLKRPELFHVSFSWPLTLRT